LNVTYTITLKFSIQRYDNLYPEVAFGCATYIDRLRFANTHKAGFNR